MKRSLVGLILLAWMAVIVTGCGAKTNVSGTSGQADQAGESGAVESAQGTEPGVRPPEMRMVVLFQSLLMMDRKDGLAITKQEAEKLLPIVKAVAESGKLDATSEETIRAQLTKPQQDFVDRSFSRLRERAAGSSPSGTPSYASPDEADQAVGELRKKRDLEKKTGKGQGDTEGTTGGKSNKADAAGEQTGYKPGNRSDELAIRGKNIEQQLIERLESKLN